MQTHLLCHNKVRYLSVLSLVAVLIMTAPDPRVCCWAAQNLAVEHCPAIDSTLVMRVALQDHSYCGSFGQLLMHQVGSG